MKLCKLQTFTFLPFGIRLRLWVILIPVYIPAVRSCDFLDLDFFQTIIDIERKRSWLRKAIHSMGRRHRQKYKRCKQFRIN